MFTMFDVTSLGTISLAQYDQGIREIYQESKRNLVILTY